MSYPLWQGEKMIKYTNPYFTHKKVTNKNLLLRKKLNVIKG
jgi:hypothetical protein